MTFVFAPLSGRLTGARGPRLPLLLAGTAMATGALLFAAFGAETHDPLLFIGYVAFGIGFGLVNAPITNTAVSGMPRAQAGVAAAVASTSRQVGQTLGVAVVGTVLATGVGAGMSAEDFVTAARPGYWVVTACGLAVLAVGALTSGKWARRTAERTARCLEGRTSVRRRPRWGRTRARTRARARARTRGSSGGEGLVVLTDLLFTYDEFQEPLDAATRVSSSTGT